MQAWSAAESSWSAQQPGFGGGRGGSHPAFSSGPQDSPSSFGSPRHQSQSGFSNGLRDSQPAFDSPPHQPQPGFGSGLRDSQPVFGSGLPDSQPVLSSPHRLSQPGFGNGLQDPPPAFAAPQSPVFTTPRYQPSPPGIPDQSYQPGPFCAQDALHNPQDASPYLHNDVSDTGSAMSADPRRRIFTAPPAGQGFVAYAPAEPFRLGTFSTICLVVNRMIGTGIFNSPRRVMIGTQTTGGALLVWLAGIVYCLAGTWVYVEYGMTIPRYVIEGVEQSVPRSGGDLNYLMYLYPKLRVVTTVFGIAFLVLGNVAGNCVQFSLSALRAAGHDSPSDGAVRGIAVATATLSCFIHAFSRRGGIVLNNVFAVVKASMLVLIVVTAICVAAGAFPSSRDVFSENASLPQSFEGGNKDVYGISKAFLAVMFSMGGFEQPNYVLGEIARPRKKYPVAMFSGVAVVVVLYMAVNLAYMAVVPAAEQVARNSVAECFFVLTFGTLTSDAASLSLEGNPSCADLIQSTGSSSANRTFHALLAVSALGNVIVMTYTAARVKQEIAKEGILPFARFFAQSYDVSLGRLLSHVRSRGHLRWLLEKKWLSPEQHSEPTPLGAIVLHFVFCLVLLLATSGVEPAESYGLLTDITTYVVYCFFGAFLGVGLLLLRLRGAPRASGDRSRRRWRDIAGPRFPHLVSILCAAIFSVCNLWPLVFLWVPPTAAYLRRVTLRLPWWLTPTIGAAVIGCGVLWWLGWKVVEAYMRRTFFKEFTIQRRPEFEPAGDRDDGLVLVHEMVILSWVGMETRHLDEEGTKRKPWSGSDGDAWAGGCVRS